MSAPSPGSAWDNLNTYLGFFLKDPLVVLGDNFSNVSNPIIIVHNFNTSHMNFIQNEHVKHKETGLDVQGRLKAYLSNALDVLGHLTSKFHETLNTTYTCYINSIKNLKT